MMAVARLCRRLDGMPLAIELAASHMRGLSATQLADQLDVHFKLLADGEGLPVRHQTLRTAAGWSHELCDAAERLLWARLSVFPAAFDTEAARGVCEDERLPGVPGVLAALAAKSVVARVGDRYRLLDTIRDYGRDWLDELGESDLMIRRHRDHYLSTARRMGAEWCGPGQLEWVCWAHRELPNIRAALDRCLTTGDHRGALELAGALWVLWCHLGLVREGRHYLTAPWPPPPPPTGPGPGRSGSPPISRSSRETCPSRAAGPRRASRAPGGTVTTTPRPTPSSPSPKPACSPATWIRRARGRTRRAWPPG